MLYGVEINFRIGLDFKRFFCFIYVKIEEIGVQKYKKIFFKIISLLVLEYVREIIVLKVSYQCFFIEVYSISFLVLKLLELQLRIFDIFLNLYLNFLNFDFYSVLNLYFQYMLGCFLIIFIYVYVSKCFGMNIEVGGYLGISCFDNCVLRQKCDGQWIVLWSWFFFSFNRYF